MRFFVIYSNKNHFVNEALRVGEFRIAKWVGDINVGLAALKRCFETDIKEVAIDTPNEDKIIKFAQAKDFLYAKHSKETQVDILPLLRLQDVEILGKKYPQINMTELQKQKANSSKFRRFLNSLKGKSYRSTNTVYRPLDFIYSPTLLVYVLILCGLWYEKFLFVFSY